MSAKGRILGLILLVIGFFLIRHAFNTHNVLMGIISVVILLMSIGKLRGY